MPDFDFFTQYPDLEYKDRIDLKPYKYNIYNISMQLCNSATTDSTQLKHASS